MYTNNTSQEFQDWNFNNKIPVFLSGILHFHRSKKPKNFYIILSLNFPAEYTATWRNCIIMLFQIKKKTPDTYSKDIRRSLSKSNRITFPLNVSAISRYWPAFLQAALQLSIPILD